MTISSSLIPIIKKNNKSNEESEVTSYPIIFKTKYKEIFNIMVDTYDMHEKIKETIRRVKEDSILQL